MKPFFIITLSLWAVCHGMVMQAQQINLRKYNIEDGLVNNDILNIYQDSHGFIWLCTRGGLSRYDGSRFTNFTTDNGLTGDMINDIYEIAPQEFIIAQNSGGPRLLKNGRIGPLIPNSTLTLNRFYRAKNNRLLVTADTIGIAEWSNGQFRPLKAGYNKSIGEIAILNDSLWLLADLSFYIQSTTPFLQSHSSLTAAHATTVFIDSHNRTWVGTIHGLRLLDPVIQTGKQMSFLPLPAAFDLPMLRNAYINSVTEDSQGNYWIATITGLIKVDRNGSSHFYTQQDGLPASFINCVKEDAQHNIWIGTPMGLAKFSLTNQINMLSFQSGPSNTGTVATLPITENKLRLFDGKRVSDLDLLTGQITNSSGIATSGYTVCKPSKKELLILMERKAMIYEAGKEQPEIIKWPDIKLSSITRIDQQTFVGVLGDALYTVSDGHYSKKLVPDTGNSLPSLAIDKDSVLWAGSWGNGLCKISVRREHDSLELKLVDTLIARLPDRHIRALYTNRKKELWIGTRYKGVVRLLELPDGKYEMQTYGTGQGLSSDFVLTINADSTGNIWVGSMQGVDKLIPEGNRYRVFNFGRLNKFFSKVHDVHFAGNIYLLGTDYPSLVYVRDMQQDTVTAPPVYITRIAAAPADSSSLLYSGPSHLPSNKAQIYFEFSSPQFINEDFTKYSYRLLGGTTMTLFSMLCVPRSSTCHFDEGEIP